MQINLDLPLSPRYSVLEIYDWGKKALFKYNMNLIEHNPMQIAKVCNAIINVIREGNCCKCNERLLYYYIYYTNRLIILYKMHAHFEQENGQ